MLELICHTPQPRVKYKSIHNMFFGKTIDLSRSSNIYQHKETGCVFAKPKFLDASYMTDYTGYNTRLTLADFGSPTGWYEKSVDNVDNLYFERGLTGDISEQRFSDLLTEPLGFVITYYNYTSQETAEKTFTIGYVDPDEETTIIQLEGYSDGQIYLTVRGVLVATGSLSPSHDSGIKYDIQDNWVRIGIIPNFMKYGVLVIANTGAELFYFDPILEEIDEELITNAQFYFFPVDRSTYQFTKLGYLSDNEILTQPYWFNNKPNVAQTTRVISVLDDYTPSYTKTLLQDDGLTAYTNQDLARVKVTFDTTDDTPFIYSIGLYIGATFTRLADGSTDIIGSIKELTINLPEDNSQSSIDIITRKSDLFDSLNIDFYTSFYIKYNDWILTHGIVEDINYPFDIRFGLSKTPVELENSTTWGILKQYVAQDNIVLDGLTLENAIRRIFNECGVDDGSLSLYSSGYTIPITRFADNGFSFEIEIGENGVDALTRLLKTFAANYMFTFYPSSPDSTFIAGPPSFFANTNIPKFYTTNEGAKLDAGYDSDLPTFLVAKDIHIDYLPFEANAVYVSGIDKVTKKFLQVFKIDYDSANPEIPILSRLKNWVGSILPYGFQDKSINSLSIASRCCRLLFGKLTKRYRLVDFDGKLRTYEVELEDLSTEDILLWIGNVCNIESIGLATIISMTINFKMHEQVEETTERNYIHCKYVVKQVYDEDSSSWTNITYN